MAVLPVILSTSYLKESEKMAEDESVDEGKEGDDADGGFRVIAVFESAVVKRVGNHRLGQILPGKRQK